MSTTTRTLSAALLALPLLAGATAPAIAAPPEKYSASGEFAEAGGLVVGSFAGLAGNLHYVSVYAEEQKDLSYGSGFLESWDCPTGVTMPWDPETGEELCTSAGFTELESLDVDLTLAKKLAAANVSGTFRQVLDYECDEMSCWPVYGASLLVDLDVTAESAKAATSRSTQSYRDPASGVLYKGTMTQKSTSGAVTGEVGGAEMVEGFGSMGTFTFKEMFKG